MTSKEMIATLKLMQAQVSSGIVRWSMQWRLMGLSKHWRSRFQKKQY